MESDVLIIGGGVIGLTTAWYAARAGCSVRVLDRQELGREASWAGAGMVLPGTLSHADDSASRLRALSYSRWPELSAELLETTGIDNGFQMCGGIEVAAAEDRARLDAEVSDWHHHGATAERLDRDALRKLEPNLSPHLESGYHLPEMAQVRNPRHLKAMKAACLAAGVVLESQSQVTGFVTRGGRISGVTLPSGTRHAGHICICAGAWSGRLLRDLNVELPVAPVRGQIVMFRTQQRVLRHIVQVGPRYLVPRADGRLLAGSTEEDSGFCRDTTPAGRRELTRFAVELVPCLDAATIERSWAGLRPGSPRGLPFLGRIPTFENLLVAAGHFRNGLQNSPATAQLLVELLLGKAPSISVDDLACPHPASASSDAAGLGI